MLTYSLIFNVCCSRKQSIKACRDLQIFLCMDWVLWAHITIPEVWSGREWNFTLFTSSDFFLCSPALALWIQISFHPWMWVKPTQGSLELLIAMWFDISAVKLGELIVFLTEFSPLPHPAWRRLWSKSQSRERLWYAHLSFSGASSVPSRASASHRRSWWGIIITLKCFQLRVVSWSKMRRGGCVKENMVYSALMFSWSIAELEERFLCVSC